MFVWTFEGVVQAVVLGLVFGTLALCGIALGFAVLADKFKAWRKS
jgi:hypothetical protein